MAAMGLDTYAPAVQAMATAYPLGSWLSTGAIPNAAPPKLPTASAVMAWELHVPSSVGDGSAASSWSGSSADLAVRISHGCSHMLTLHTGREFLHSLLCPSPSPPTHIQFCLPTTHLHLSPHSCSHTLQVRLVIQDGFGKAYVVVPLPCQV